VTIEAARGSQDVSFEVYGGHLGITVSPSLHRSRVIHYWRKRVRQAQRKEGIVERAIEAIESLFTGEPEHATKREPVTPELIEVPGELARKVAFLAKAVEVSGFSKLRKSARSLLSAADPRHRQ